MHSSYHLNPASHTDKSGGATNAYAHASGGDGQMTPMTPGQISYFRNMQSEATPKYIKDLRSELTVALKKNLELSHKLELKEEELESDVQNLVI